MAKWLGPSKSHPAGCRGVAGGGRMPPHSPLPLPAALGSTRGPGLAWHRPRGGTGWAPLLPLPTTSAHSASKHLLRGRHGLRGLRFTRGRSERASPQSSARLLTTRLARDRDSCHRASPLLHSAVLTQRPSRARSQCPAGGGDTDVAAGQAGSNSKGKTIACGCPTRTDGTLKRSPGGLGDFEGLRPGSHSLGALG